MKKIISAVMAFIICVSALCPVVYAGNKNISNNLNISKSSISHDVSSTLYGMNIEDISNSFDGGLVSNLVNNNSFEYQTKSDYAWEFNNIKAVTQDKLPMNSVNTNYLSLTIDGKGEVRNLGYTELYEGSQKNYNKNKADKADMPFKKDTKYDFGCYLRNVDFEGTISVYLDSPSNSHRINQLNTSGIGNKKWSYLYTTLLSVATEDGALVIEFDGKGTILLDFVTLVSQDSHGFDDDSWKYTTVRSDLYNSMVNLKPSFLKFYPNGLSKGDSLNDLYNWKNTIGPLEERKQNTNYYADDVKGRYYNNSNFLGFHECLQLSKDLGAEPIPVVNAGMIASKNEEYCLYKDALNKLNMSDEQWSSYLISQKDFNNSQIAEYTQKINALAINSKQDYDNCIEKIALTPGTDEFYNYAQDILDLIEYANADSKTSYWGALRGSNGSDAPFGIDYIAIGNNNFGEVYLRNFEALYKIIKGKYPNIKIIACGCDSDSLNSQIYKAINERFNDVIVDESYIYNENEFYQNDKKYDAYDRQKSAIMLSKYNVDSSGKYTDLSNNNLSSALEEACIMTSLEKNSDIVQFSAYAPTFAKINAQDSNENLIWFDSQSLALTPNYFVKMLFSNNIGTKYIDTQKISENIYQSVTIDESTQTIYIKLVNKGKKDKLSISLNDFDNINLVSNIKMNNKYLSAYNNLNDNYIVPCSENSITEFENNTFDITLDKNSINVIRVAYGENTGIDFYELPDNIDYNIEHYLPQDIKIAVLSVILVAIILVIAIGIFVKKYDKYNSKNKKQ